MNLVVAVIRPQNFGAVAKTLQKHGIRQLTVSNVLGGGHEPGHGLIYRGASINNQLHARLKLEIAVDESSVADVVEAIQLSAKTGQVGDGVIWVLPISQAVRIRTGEELTWQANQRPGASPKVAPQRLLGQFTNASPH